MTPTDFEKDIFRGKWKKMRGQVKGRWSKLAGDDLEQANSNAEQIVGLFQQKNKLKT